MSTLYLLFGEHWMHAAYAEEPVATARLAEAGSLSGVLMQTLLGLLLVLGLIVILAYLFNRLSKFSTGSSQAIQVVASVRLGNRERAVVVQVGDTQLLLGVTPQSISHLHTLHAPLTPTASPHASVFANKLKSLLHPTDTP